MANQRAIGFVFQNYALFPHLSVFENVAYGLRVKGMPPAEIASATAEVLHMVGLSGYDRQHPHQLSGGEQQRVALARAVVIRPRVLLFDEPLSNLDAKLRVHMRGELRDLQKRLSITAVYVTHDQEEAMAISDRIVVMQKGEIVQEGTAEDLYHAPQSEFVAQFIGRTNLLAAKVAEADTAWLTLEVAGHRCKIAAGPGGAPAGAPVRLVLRPEVIGLEPPGGGSGIPGTVRSRVFLGEKVEYCVEVGAETLQVTEYNAQRIFAPGQPVCLRLPTEGVPILPGGAA
jgi:iron(III) transport system ATP-binding protein